VTSAAIRRTSSQALWEAIGGPHPPLLLDARRSEALRRRPLGIPTAVPVLLDEPDLRIPEVARSHAIVVYCLCSGQASSTRVALRLADAGYDHVSVLDGGLPAWERAGLPLTPIDARTATLRPQQVVEPHADSGPLAVNPQQLIAERAFLAGQTLPLRRDMAVLFVDMVDSTQLVFSRSPDDVLRLVQAFMEEVVQVAVTHCGDVHDFEGDGAMLYFAGVGEALPAAFDLLTALNARRQRLPDLPHARIALDAGSLVVGYVGTAARRSLSFIGPSINTAARILKLASPDGIVATERVVVEGRRTDPDLAARLTALPERRSLKGIAEPVTVFAAGTAAVCHECP